MQTFDFNEQFELGKAGERKFISSYAELGPVLSTDKSYDVLLDSGEKVEIKTDTYSMDATPNFFMEYYSDADKLTIGGPWRAKRDEIDFFVYYFAKNSTFFWFKSKELSDYLDKILIEKNFKTKRVRNKTWYTEGFAVPRELLTSLEIRRDTF